MVRGQKLCKSCGRGVGCRTKQCYCGSVFVKNDAKEKESKIYSVTGRGKKACPNCSFIVGVRSFECPSCHHLFEIKGKKKRKKLEKIDWKELRKGDKIKVRGGPYWLTQAGESIPMGENGKLRVISLDVDGLFCYNRKNKRVFVYMGSVRTSRHGTKMRPHILRKVVK